MQFAGFSKAFMTRQAARPPVAAPFQHQCGRNRDALSKPAGIFPDEGGLSSAIGSSAVPPDRTRATIGESNTGHREAVIFAEGRSPPASIAGFQNAATLL
jgi:hypothetical protein